MKVLMSIKPEFAEKIFNGTKQYEFRRTLFIRQDITTVLVYASSPVQRIIGEFEIEAILHEKLQQLWQLTKNHSGITEPYFIDYFHHKDTGYAIKIKTAKRYENALPLDAIGKTRAPQSFMYI